MGLALEEEKGERLTLMGEVALLRREAEREKKNAKYDLAAREGQTKRLGILEHTVTTLRHDLGTNVERRYGTSSHHHHTHSLYGQSIVVVIVPLCICIVPVRVLPSRRKYTRKTKRTAGAYR